MNFLNYFENSSTFVWTSENYFGPSHFFQTLLFFFQTILTFFSNKTLFFFLFQTLLLFISNSSHFFPNTSYFL